MTKQCLMGVLETLHYLTMLLKLQGLLQQKRYEDNNKW